MRILLVGPNLEENLSLEYLAASIEANGFEALFGQFNSYSDAPTVLELARDVDIIGLSMVFQARAIDYLNLAKEIKKLYPEKPVIAGGHYASCAADDLLENHPELNLIVIHEGEITIVELMQYYQNRNKKLEEINGIVYRKENKITYTEKRCMIEDLDLLPFPNRKHATYFIAGVPTAFLMGSRGCYNNCYYCCISTLHNLVSGKKYRQRSVKNIVEEMEELYENKHIRHFVFHDDNFLVKNKQKNIDRLIKLEKEIKERDLEHIGITIKCCPTEADADVFSILKRIGLVRVFLGIESSSDAVISSFNRRQHINDSIKALKICEDLGISVQFNLMVLNPSATFETMRNDIKFLKNHISYPFNFYRTEIYAGTPLEQMMMEEGRVWGNYLARSYTMPNERLNFFNLIFIKVFYKRCWNQNSIMLKSTGLEHWAAMLNHHYKDFNVRPLVDKIMKARIKLNKSSIYFLNRLIDLAEDCGTQIKINEIMLEESENLKEFEQLFDSLEKEIDGFTLQTLGLEKRECGKLFVSKKIKKLAPHAAAALIALMLTGCMGETEGDNKQKKLDVLVNEYAAQPLSGERVIGHTIINKINQYSSHSEVTIEVINPGIGTTIYRGEIPSKTFNSYTKGERDNINEMGVYLITNIDYQKNGKIKKITFEKLEQ